MEKKSHKTPLSLKYPAAALLTGAATSGANSAVSTAQHHASHLSQQHYGIGSAIGSSNSSNINSNIIGNMNVRHRVSASSNLHHHNNNSYSAANNNNTNNSIRNVGLKAAANAALEKLNNTVGSKTVSSRNKNEEAIVDLRQRIPDIENIFDVHSRIGNGTFSTVLLGTLKKDRDLPESMRRKFAIKHHIPTSHPDRIIKELKCMVDIGGSDNVVGINCTIRHNESVAFIMPYMPHDRFHDFFNKMDLSEVQCYMRNLLIALRRVHKFNVIHRDVKPSNFLYNRRKRQFLLVDFGLAQQVPTPQTTSLAAIASVAHSNNNNNNSNTNNNNNCFEGKRPREHDDVVSSERADASHVAAGSGKRLRCTGPQGDQQVSVGSAEPNARVTNSCAQVGGSPFKMPLKQLNEISAPSKNCAPNVSSTNSSIYEAPLSRQVKSAILGATMSNRLQQKLRGGQANSGRSPANVGGGANAGEAVVNSPSSVLPGNNNNTNAPQSPCPNDGQAPSKYNTNRNLSTSHVPKCFCYGNPQVCNICLIKKEIHASRAGTPGYRPPEVLLKYPDQTTAVDIWAAGVILLSILSSVYPFFKAPNDYVALAEMVTIFGDKTIRKTAFVLDRLVTLSQKTKPLDLRKLCVRFRNRAKFSSPDLLKKYQRPDGSCEVCKNCDQFYFNCLCAETHYATEPLGGDDPFPASAYDLLCKLLEVNPHKRITAEEALKHPFFSEHAEYTTIALKKHSRD